MVFFSLFLILCFIDDRKDDSNHCIAWQDVSKACKYQVRISCTYSSSKYLVLQLYSHTFYYFLHNFLLEESMKSSNEIQMEVDCSVNYHDEENLCCICKNHPINIKFSPCNHKSFCRRCHARLPYRWGNGDGAEKTVNGNELFKSCPLCRGFIEYVEYC